jgi:hypothetical protein
MASRGFNRHFVPVVIATAVAMIGLGGLLLVNHGPWSKPKIQNETMIQYGTTAASAAAVGATVSPTAPKPEREPSASGPKRVQPAIPDQRKS